MQSACQNRYQRLKSRSSPDFHLGPFSTAVAGKRFGALLLTTLLMVRLRARAWDVRIVQAHTRRLLCVLAGDLRGRVGISPIKAVAFHGLFPDFIYYIAEYARDGNDDHCSMPLLTGGCPFEILDNNCHAWVDKHKVQPTLATRSCMAKKDSRCS